MNAFRPALRAALLFVVAFSGAAISRGQSASEEIQALREQIRQLDQKLQALERKNALEEEAAAAAAKSTAKVTANDRAFSVGSADGLNALRLRGLVQADSRWFPGSGLNNNDTFLIRRARIFFEGTFNKIFAFQIVPEFGGSAGNGTLNLIDAAITATLNPALQVRIGRFREPVGLEQSQSDSVAFFTERTVVSQFVPNRDIGVQIGGDLAGGVVNYAVGIFNGVADGSNNTNNAENNNKKDFAGRVIVTPFKHDKESFFHGLGFGVAGTFGEQNGAAGGLTSGYRTDGQQTFFTYRAGTAAKGDTHRISPQAFFYNGPFGMHAEYVASSVEVINGVTKGELEHKAWQVSAGYVLTGEDSAYAGVVPKTNFSADFSTWGAFELVARVSHADIDDDSFVGGANSFANPANSATEITSYGIGLNWYLSKAVRASFNYFHSNFEFAPGAAPLGNTVIGNDENAILTRLQLVF